MLLDVSNRSPRTVLVLLDLAGLDEVAQDALSIEAVFQLLLALLDLGLVLLELGELLLKRSVLSLRLLALSLHFSGRTTTLRPYRDHVHTDSVLDCYGGQQLYTDDE